MDQLSFLPPIDLSTLDALRAEVREFLAREFIGPGSHAYLGGDDPAFSEKVSKRGWIGMTWPKKYGGGERSTLERYVVAEELLAARAPLGAHWIADRQAGPLLLKYGTEHQRQLILPRIVAGKCRFCIGMSEPDSGSDLASVITKAEKASGGFVLSGRKVWISGAHLADYMIVFCRTSPRMEARHEGLSQLLVDLKLPGIEIRPIKNLARHSSFSEVVFNDVFIDDCMLVGELGQGWTQVNSELAFERAGPERFLSSFGLLTEFIDHVGAAPSERAAVAVGRLVAHLAAARRLSRSVATMQHGGDIVALQAAMVKDIGTSLEQEICEVVRGLADIEPDLFEGNGFLQSLGEVIADAPSFTLRGGTREVLRGIIARGAGVR